METILKKKAKEFMTKKVIAVHENESIKNLFKLMDEHGILGTPVVNDDQKVTGIVTEGDLLEHFTTLKEPRSINLLGGIVYLDDIRGFNENLKGHCAETVKELMRSPAVTLKESDTMQKAIDTMAERKVNRLPVVDGHQKLVGIVTRSDIVHQLSKIKAV